MSAEREGNEIEETRQDEGVERVQIARKASAKGENEEKRETVSKGIEESRSERFDWATDIDTSIGPVPSASDFRSTKPPSRLASPKPAPQLPDNPVTPSQPVRTPPAPTECTPAAYAPTAPALVNPDPGDEVCAPGPNGIALARTVLTESAPVNITPADPISLDNRIPNAHVDAFVNTPTVYAIPARALRDLSGLRSGVRNPWSNLSRRRSYIHPPRDLSSLRSSTLNPWSSLRHRDRRSHPLHPHQYSDSEPLRHSHSNLLHPEPARLPTNPESHFPAQSPIEPIQLFQIIQHPCGISLNKPKITKTIPPTPAKIQKNTCTARCACGNIIPAYSPDRDSWRSMDISRRRFEGGFRFRRRFSRGFSWRFSRRFCDW